MTHFDRRRPAGTLPLALGLAILALTGILLATRPEVASASGIALALGAGVLFCSVGVWQLSRPHRVVFDETHCTVSPRVGRDRLLPLAELEVEFLSPFRGLALLGLVVLCAPFVVGAVRGALGYELHGTNAGAFLS
ncbi:MAG: hypothetical protein AB7N76_35305 [Planctomycetota bacterium]